jgi:hypothetical protein
MSDKEAEALVTDWVNATTEYPTSAEHPYSDEVEAAIAKADASIHRLLRKYPGVFKSLPVFPPPGDKAESTVTTDDWGTIAFVQSYLRLAWNAKELRESEWHLFKAREHFHSHTGYVPLFLERVGKAANPKDVLEQGYTEEENTLRFSAPDWTPFEQAIYHLQGIATKMRRCGNEDCPAPYFLAKKGSQKYCGPDCSHEAACKQRRDWWRENRSVPALARMKRKAKTTR